MCPCAGNGKYTVCGGISLILCYFCCVWLARVDMIRFRSIWNLVVTAKIANGEWKGRQATTANFVQIVDLFQDFGLFIHLNFGLQLRHGVLVLILHAVL